MVKEKLYSPVVELTAIEPIGMNVGGGGLPMGSGGPTPGISNSKIRDV